MKPRLSRVEKAWAFKRGQFTMILNSFITSKEYTVYEKMVYIVIKKFRMKHETCWPGISTMAECVGCGPTSIKKAIASLIAKGIISKEKDPKRRSNTYRILREPV